MRKLISLLLCLAMLTSMLASAAWAENEAAADDPLTESTGDANADGKVNNKDAAALLKRVTGWDVTLNGPASDLNGDGSINAKDVSVLLKYLAGWNVTFATMPKLYNASFTKSRAELSAEAAELCASDDGAQPWNEHATQFMYAPTVSFEGMPSAASYKFTVTGSDRNGLTFTAETSTASVAEVWNELPEGSVTVRCTGLDADGNVINKCGERTFYKIASFPTDVPAQTKRYYDAARDAYAYLLSQDYITYWEEEAPDDTYELYCYPSKMVSEVINSMLKCTEFFPDKAEFALMLAENAAKWLISVTATDGPMKGVPPTYIKNGQYNLGEGVLNVVMTIYPAHVGSAYLRLYDKTDDSIYLDAAVAIGEFYKAKVRENGSWALTMDINTGEELSENSCEPVERIVPFLTALYEATGVVAYKTLCDGAVAYVENVVLPVFNWEAQFEDAGVSSNYENLTHYGAAALARYYAENYPDDEEKKAISEKLARFVEDQFVVWTDPAPEGQNGYDTAEFSTPCGLEQYHWYVPIDASTSDIMLTFLSMYDYTGSELYLAKALALANQLTVMQNKNGMIPTHWMSDLFREGASFWINCMCVSADALTKVSEAIGEKQYAVYEQAAERIRSTELVLGNGSGAIITDDVITALENASFREAKNIIFMIGDGMGFAQIMATEKQFADQLYDGKLAMNLMPVQSYQTTYCYDSDVTDSAAGGTALSTGYKIPYGTVGMNGKYEPIQTTLELAAEYGKSTGVVVTKPVTDATPADFTAHTKSRGNTDDIVTDQLESLGDGTLDLLLGGGYGDFDKDKFNDLMDAAKTGAGLTYTKDFEEVKNSALPVLGLFSSGALNTYDSKLPTIAEMTAYAIDKLSQDENGFFLMVEGSQIDSGGHSNSYDLIYHETYQFDEAIAVALRFAALNPDTVIIITADHETGGLSFDHDATAENITSRVGFMDGNHSGVAVPVRAIGYRTEELAGHNENVELGAFVGSVLGNDEFGFRSERTLIEDFDGGLEFTFTPDDQLLELGYSDFDVSPEDVANPRVMYLTVTNKGDTYSYAPIMYIESQKNDYFMTSQIPYIEPGQTVRLTYTIPDDFWRKGLNDVYEIYFCFSDFAADIRGTSIYKDPSDYSFTLEFSDLTLVSRDPTK